MNKTLRVSLVVTVVVVAVAAVLLAGLNFGRLWWNPMAGWSGSMMGSHWDISRGQSGFGAGHGMMAGRGVGGWGMGSGMMGGAGMTGWGMGAGGSGCRGWSQTSEREPLSLAEAEQAVEAFLNEFGNDDLVVGEIMIFDNHAYAQLVERSSGVGALEVLIDPVTGQVLPEPGPNMMWNLKYSPMGSAGMMGMMGASSFSPQDRGGWGGMMGGWGAGRGANPSDEMKLSAEQAIEQAQRYLERYDPALTAANEADAFYGYYTIHTMRDGETWGMLSVNGYSGEVFPHTWHGSFVEMSEDH